MTDTKAKTLSPDDMRNIANFIDALNGLGDEGLELDFDELGIVVEDETADSGYTSIGEVIEERVSFGAFYRFRPALED